MSSSSSPPPTLETAVRPMQYPEMLVDSADADRSGASAASNDAAAGNAAAAEAREAGARETGKQEGETCARAAFNAQLEEIRGSVRSALADFAQERTRYFQQVEIEVVKLALSIARKVLHREAQVDPLLLAGMVRVALGKIESGTQVTVRVNPHQVSECRTYFAQHLEARDVPEVVEDAQLPLDHCVLKTEMGTTELGVEIQLKEIEQGLLDLMEQRPKVGA